MIERGGSNAIGLTKLQYAEHRIRELETVLQDIASGEIGLNLCIKYARQVLPQSDASAEPK
jgi:hypothetical protein